MNIYIKKHKNLTVHNYKHVRCLDNIFQIRIISLFLFIEIDSKSKGLLKNSIKLIINEYF